MHIHTGFSTELEKMNEPDIINSILDPPCAILDLKKGFLQISIIRLLFCPFLSILQRLKVCIVQYM